jgi:hypothetical protein
MQAWDDVIEAFIDDERVDVEDLKEALAKPEGREYLIELLALREVVAGKLPAAPTRSVPRRGFRWLTLAAACVAVASVSVGYSVGRYRGEPGASVPSQGVLQVVRQVSPPSPTSVIRLQSGVDWTETPGGN